MTDNQGMTTLHLACLYGHLKIVKVLVDAGADLKCKDKDAIEPTRATIPRKERLVGSLAFVSFWY